MKRIRGFNHTAIIDCRGATEKELHYLASFLDKPSRLDSMIQGKLRYYDHVRITCKKGKCCEAAYDCAAFYINPENTWRFKPFVRMTIHQFFERQLKEEQNEAQ